MCAPAPRRAPASWTQIARVEGTARYREAPWRCTIGSSDCRARKTRGGSNCGDSSGPQRVTADAADLGPREESCCRMPGNSQLRWHIRVPVPTQVAKRLSRGLRKRLEEFQSVVRAETCGGPGSPNGPRGSRTPLRHPSVTIKSVDPALLRFARWLERRPWNSPGTDKGSVLAPTPKAIGRSIPTER